MFQLFEASSRFTYPRRTANLVAHGVEIRPVSDQYGDLAELKTVGAVMNGHLTHHGVPLAASNCIDGVNNANWAETCTSPDPPAPDVEPFLVVELEQMSLVEGVHIYNRLDSHSKNLALHEVWVSETPDFDSPKRCLRATAADFAGLIVETCDTKHVGMFVKIVLPGPPRTLSLNEFVVLGRPGAGTTHDDPEATYGPVVKAFPVSASLSTQYTSVHLHGATVDAHNCIDGVTDNKSWKVLCHTKRENSPHLVIELAEPFLVERVDIYNRYDYNAKRLGKHEVRVSATADFAERSGEGNECLQLTAPAVQGLISEECYHKHVGRFVKIVLPGPDRVLNLAEVEVFGRRVVSVAAEIGRAHV